MSWQSNEEKVTPTQTPIPFIVMTCSLLLQTFKCKISPSILDICGSFSPKKRWTDTPSPFLFYWNAKFQITNSFSKRVSAYSMISALAIVLSAAVWLHLGSVFHYPIRFASNIKLKKITHCAPKQWIIWTFSILWLSKSPGDVQRQQP